MADQPSAARLRPVFRQGMPGLPAAAQQQNQAFYVGPGDFLDLPDQGGQSDNVDVRQDRRNECSDLGVPGGSGMTDSICDTQHRSTTAAIFTNGENWLYSSPATWCAPWASGAATFCGNTRELAEDAGYVESAYPGRNAQNLIDHRRRFKHRQHSRGRRQSIGGSGCQRGVLAAEGVGCGRQLRQVFRCPGHRSTTPNRPASGAVSAIVVTMASTADRSDGQAFESTSKGLCWGPPTNS
ncbi:hypothetical protein WSS_A34552 [Rhodococcus opacus M213]|uniref:Uncharacterized protein n=1 Tax=Rhodococcus opacus M213 TaxID=1129896 RepID=K8X983_RHOOP|nr:hypothetical protein WSS_A34552 [Rhodococcus opacus M213]